MNIFTGFNRYLLDCCKKNGEDFVFYSIPCLFVCLILFVVLTVLHVMFSMKRFDIQSLLKNKRFFKVLGKVVYEEMDCARPAFIALSVSVYLSFVYADLYRFFSFSSFYLIPSSVAIILITAFYTRLGIKHDEKRNAKKILRNSKTRTSVSLYCA